MSLVSLISVGSAMSEVSESVPPIDIAESMESRTTGRNLPNTDPAIGGVLLDMGIMCGEPFPSKPLSLCEHDDEVEDVDELLDRDDELLVVVVGMMGPRR